MQNTTGRLLVIIALSIVVKGEVAKETVNYGTKTRAYVPIWARTKQTFIGLENTLQNAFSVQNYGLQDALKMSCKDVFKTSWRRLEEILQNVLQTSWRHVLKRCSRHILKMSWRHYGDYLKRILTRDICILQV